VKQWQLRLEVDAIYAVVDFLEAGLLAPLDLGLAFAEAGLVVLLTDLVFALTAAAFAATFLVSFFVLVVFLVDGFFTVAAFLVVVVAFFVDTAGFLVVEAFSVDLVLLAGAFFVGAAFAFSVAFFTVELFLGGLVFSLESAVALGRLGASLTLPEGPLGKTKVSFSAPRVRAKLS